MTVTREAIKNYFPDGGLERRLQPLPKYGCIYVRNAKVATGSRGVHESMPTGSSTRPVASMPSASATSVPTLPSAT